MSKIIIDSSTIHSFQHLLERFSPMNSKLFKYSMGQAIYDIYENVLEALILYDEVLFDSESIGDDIWKYGIIDLSLLPFCSRVTSEECSRVEYKRILDSIHIASSQLDSLPYGVNFHWESLLDPHGNIGFSSPMRWDPEYEKLCNEFILNNVINDSLNNDDIHRIIYYGIVRFLYYQKLSSLYNASLVIHPNRGIIALALSEHRRLFNSSVLFKKFEKVGKAQQYRFSEYMPITFNTIRLPLVTNFVFNKIDWRKTETFADAIINVRNMPEVKDFRQGLDELTALLLRTDKDSTVELSHIFNDLNIAIDCWSKRLDVSPNTKTRVATIGATTLSFNVNAGIAGFNVGQSHNQESYIKEDENHPITSKMLTFIHTTICNSIQR